MEFFVKGSMYNRKMHEFNVSISAVHGEILKSIFHWHIN